MTCSKYYNDPFLLFIQWENSVNLSKTLMDSSCCHLLPTCVQDLEYVSRQPKRKLEKNGWIMHYHCLTGGGGGPNRASHAADPAAAATPVLLCRLLGQQEALAAAPLGHRRRRAPRRPDPGARGGRPALPRRPPRRSRPGRGVSPLRFCFCSWLPFMRCCLIEFSIWLVLLNCALPVRRIEDKI